MNFYRQNMTIGGDFAMITAVPVFNGEKKKGGSRRRRSKCNPTKEAQAFVNKRRAEEYFFYFIHENYTLKDNRLDLDFSDQHLPKDVNELKKKMRNFKDRLKRRCANLGIELKMVWVPERSGAGRFHIHGFIDGRIPTEVIREAWGLGRANTSPFQYDRQGLAGYVHYVFKDPLLSKHWCATKNHKKPKERKSDYSIRQKDVAAVRCGDFGELEKRLKGWEVVQAQYEWEEPTVFNWSVVEAEVCDNEVNGLPYLYIKLCKKNAKLSY